MELQPYVINETGLTDEEVLQLRAMGFEVAAQGSEEWLEERLGLATASRFFDIVDWTAGSKPLKDGSVTTPPNPKETYYKYKNELIAERLTGKMKRFVKSKPMEWGNQNEEAAAALYQEMTGADVKEVGFIKHATIECGASLDRTVDEDGCLEIKCPNTDTMVKYLLDDAPPPQYYAQMQGQMWIGKKQWCDFMVYDPEMPEHLQVFLKRVPRDEEFIADMEEKIVNFLARVDKEESYLKKITKFRIEVSND